MTTEVTAQATAQADARAQASADPKLQPPAKQADDAKQPVAAVAANAAKPAAGTTQQPQAATPSVSSAAQAQQQTGTGAHTGNGSGGHSGTPGQPNAGTGASTTSSSAGGSQASAAFSIEQAAASSTTGSREVASAASHGLDRSGVTLQDAFDAVKATFTAANQAGVSSARISLSPESLGGIKISLSQTPDGLIARVATDHPEAAATLQQSAGELKRSLEAGGMSLLRLDIGSSGQQSLGSFGGSTGDGSNSGARASGGQVASSDDDIPSTPTEQTLELSSGSLVNVLA
jgi:flagellar hook-length control protein FliK